MLLIQFNDKRKETVNAASQTFFLTALNRNWSPPIYISFQLFFKMLN